LRELLEEACKRAQKIIDEKNPDLSEEEKNDIAEKIGIGAVKYADLSQYRTTDYIFSWEKMLSLHGNTAPYLQNAYVRIRSIFRKADVAAPNSLDLSQGRCSRPRCTATERRGYKYRQIGFDRSRGTQSCQTSLSVCGNRSASLERISPQHPCKLSIRAG